jgi:hypothetical protein
MRVDADNWLTLKCTVDTHSGPKEKHEYGSQLYQLNFPIKPGHITKDFRKWTNGAPANLCLCNLPKLDRNTQFLSY